jgi:hypothetical protein
MDETAKTTGGGRAFVLVWTVALGLYVTARVAGWWYAIATGKTSTALMTGWDWAEVGLYHALAITLPFVLVHLLRRVRSGA